MKRALSIVPASEDPGGFLFLLPEAIRTKLAERSAHGDFSGEGVKQANPELYAIVVKLGGIGMSLRLASEITGLSKNTIAEIYHAANVGTAAANEKLAGMLRKCLALALDEMMKKLEDGGLKAADLNVFIGIATDKLVALQGGPTINIHHRHEHVVPGFEAHMAKLKQAAQMGLLQVSPQQRAEPGAAGSSDQGADLAAGAIVVEAHSSDQGADLAAGAIVVEAHTADEETAVSQAANRDGAPHDTGNVTGSSTAEACQRPGGGGGRATRGAAGEARDPDSRNPQQSE